MAKFIEVTNDGVKALVDANKILAVFDYGDCAFIRFNEVCSFSIDETYEEIKTKLEVVND